MEGGTSVRRRPTLAQQMSVMERSNLQNLLRIREEEDRRESLAGLTLGAILGCEEKKSDAVSVTNRTLLDVIKDEESGNSYRGFCSPNNKNGWKSLRDRLRNRRAITACSSPISNTAGDDYRIGISHSFPATQSTEDSISVIPATIVTTSGITTAGDSIPTTIQPENASNRRENNVTESDSATAINEQVFAHLAEALAAERAQQQEQEQEQQRSASSNSPEENELNLNPDSVTEREEASIMEERETPVTNRVSLMTLLEETDRHGGVLVGANEEEEEEEENEREGREVKDSCCVCMVRHKGAAFIPCGHTFCRICSRELWVSRGNCPLCNVVIVEILDIF